VRGWFQHDMLEASDKFETIIFCDGFSYHELLASDVRDLMDLKGQIELMAFDRNEMPWTELTRQAQDLSELFESIVKTVGLEKILDEAGK
jgi:hypothetical protein